MEKFEIGKKYVSYWKNSESAGKIVYECVNRSAKFATFKIDYMKYDFQAGVDLNNHDIYYDLNEVKTKYKIKYYKDKYEYVNPNESEFISAKDKEI